MPCPILRKGQLPFVAGLYRPPIEPPAPNVKTPVAALTLPVVPSVIVVDEALPADPP
jgi:hypothetical protein